MNEPVTYEGAHRDWVLQYEGDRLEPLARTIADRIFLKSSTSWYSDDGGQENGSYEEVSEMVDAAVARAKHVGLMTFRRWAADVLIHWGQPYSSGTSSDED